MKKIIKFLAALILLTSCSNSCAQTNKNPEDGTTTNYVDSTTATANAIISDDLYQNFKAAGTVTIKFTGTSWETSFEGDVTDSDVSIKAVKNSTEDEAAAGVEIQYKGKLKLKYVLSGNYTGTVFIKNKSADAAVVLNGISISSDNGAGPVLRFSSEKRTFIVAAAGTTNNLTDTRVKDQSSTIYDDKKGSVYSKGTLIFTGGGTLNIINSGYKHAVYVKDYVRIAEGTNLNISVIGETGRDCIRANNAVIIDGGNINLLAKGTLLDDESNGIRVDGEDADEDEMTVEYTAGAGFIIINGGNLNITTVAKGITAHWKADQSVIGNASYTETVNNSLLCNSFLKGTSQSKPDPFVEINGGIINITTTGEPYEGRTDDDPSCSPEGIEAKANLTINAGTITIQTTDDSINSGGNFTMNGGAVYAYSSKNDAIDANGRNGITINGGVVVAIGLNMPECAFDCDNSLFTINGGTVVGLGTSMYSAPTSGKQSTGVLASSNYGSANTTMAIVDSKGNPVFVYTLPAGTGDIMILSSPDIKAGTTYTVKTGVTVSGGVRFHNLYTTLPTIKGGTATLKDFATSSSNMVYTDSSAGSGFGNFGGGPGRNFGGRQAFPDGMTLPDGMTAPDGMTPPDGMQLPDGFNGQFPEGMTPPDGQGGNFGGRQDFQKGQKNFKGTRNKQ